jgi:hypothetical protein
VLGRPLDRRGRADPGQIGELERRIDVELPLDLELLGRHRSPFLAPDAVRAPAERR